MVPVHSWNSFCDSSGWQQEWADEFDTFDSDSWTKDVGPPPKWGDSKVRDASALPGNVYIEDGALVMKTQAEWKDGAWTNITSGAVDSKGKRSWSGRTRVCVSAKLPGGGQGAGHGIWPAHWLMPDDSSCWPCHGEIDIMEMINGDGKLRGTYHWGSASGDNHKQGTDQKLSEDWANEWHEYAVEYDGSSYARFAFDGKVYGTVKDGPEFHNVPYYAILNTAVGGGWPKPPDENTVFPTWHHVDYVRVAKVRSSCQGTLLNRSTNMNAWYSDRDARLSDCEWACSHETDFACNCSVFSTANQGSCEEYGSKLQVV